MGIEHSDCGGLYGYATLPFYLHGIQHLFLHIPDGHGIRKLHHAVRKGGLAVIDVGDYAKVSYKLAAVCHCCPSREK